MRRAPLFRGCVQPSWRAGSLRGITRLRGVLRVALESSVELTAAPRPGALDFNLEREAERDADDDDHAQNGEEFGTREPEKEVAAKPVVLPLTRSGAIISQSDAK